MIELRNVTKFYGHRVGVQDLTFRVAPGEILGLLGPNGAGKTTTLRMLTGYLAPSQGRIRVGGLDLWDDPEPARRLVGYLPDRPPVYREMSVRRFVTFAAELRGVPRRMRREQVNLTLTRTGLTHVADRLIGNLSRGYQQRIGLAQALVHDPPVLVLDEPTAGLDPRQIHEIRQVIRDLAGTRTVILSSHLLPEVEALCQRVLIMDRGRVLVEDTPARLAAAVRGAHCYRVQTRGCQQATLALIRNLPGIIRVTPTDGGLLLETDQQVDVRPDLFFALAAAGLPLLELTPVRLSLEDVFLRLTTHEQKEGSA